MNRIANGTRVLIDGALGTVLSSQRVAQQRYIYSIVKADHTVVQASISRIQPAR